MARGEVDVLKAINILYNRSKEFIVVLYIFSRRFSILACAIRLLPGHKLNYIVIQ